MDAVKDIKAGLRKRGYAARKAAYAKDRVAVGAMSLAARDHLLAARLHTGAEIVSGYCPIRTETDVMPLMTALHAAGHRLCVPVIEAAGQPLRFREWSPEAELVDGPFGARVPANGEWLEPQFLIAPLVAFDRQCWRLGYGGGFYDRTLERLRAKRRTIAVGFAYAAQQIEQVPRDPTDQQLDGVVTEQGLIRPELSSGSAG
ncbi:MAG: 5-formyltetrahydrofolate cyclo-ligase [Paracoccaceae bacterium]|nr:5-formyltetrahydrofolate cyclo-ligase [Paracoccaceae bacterium]